MSKYKVTIDGKAIEAEVVAKSYNSIEMRINNKTHSVSVSPTLTSKRASNNTQSNAANSPHCDSANISSPIPGVIANIHVSVGDTVKTGQTALVIEAMKMENNIPVQRPGVVKKIHCKLNQEINQNDLLIEIDESKA